MPPPTTSTSWTAAHKLPRDPYVAYEGASKTLFVGIDPVFATAQDGLFQRTRRGTYQWRDVSEDGAVEAVRQAILSLTDDEWTRAQNNDQTELSKIRGALRTYAETGKYSEKAADGPLSRLEQVQMSVYQVRESEPRTTSPYRPVSSCLPEVKMMRNHDNCFGGVGNVLITFDGTVLSAADSSTLAYIKPNAFNGYVEGLAKDISEGMSKHLSTVFGPSGKRKNAVSTSLCIEPVAQAHFNRHICCSIGPDDVVDSKARLSQLLASNSITRGQGRESAKLSERIHVYHNHAPLPVDDLGGPELTIVVNYNQWDEE